MGSCKYDPVCLAKTSNIEVRYYDLVITYLSL